MGELITADNSKLFRDFLADPTQRRQLTFGPGDDEGACYSRDGKKLYFSSDRDQGIFDLDALDLTTRDLSRLTRVIGGALSPVAVPTRDGERANLHLSTCPDRGTPPPTFELAAQSIGPILSCPHIHEGQRNE